MLVNHMVATAQRECPAVSGKLQSTDVKLTPETVNSLEKLLEMSLTRVKHKLRSEDAKIRGRV